MKENQADSLFTVEEPNEKFERLRDRVDTQIIIQATQKLGIESRMPFDRATNLKLLQAATKLGQVGSLGSQVAKCKLLNCVWWQTQLERCFDAHFLRSLQGEEQIARFRLETKRRILRDNRVLCYPILLEISNLTEDRCV